MNSTLISNDNDLICKITNLSLVTKRDFYPVMSLRDRCIDFFKPNMKITETILNNISAQVERGDNLGVIGLNGAGKTTLCKVIAGMYQPTSGDIQVNGSLRTIFNNGAVFYPNLSGRENIELLVSFFYPNEIGNMMLIDNIIDFSELDHLIDTPFITYSNGMKCRLLLSVALQKSADLLIFDESFEGADFYFAQKAITRAKKLITSSSASIVVSHSVSSLRSLCNKVIVLNQGCIVYEGDVESGIKVLFDLPNNMTKDRSLKI